MRCLARARVKLPSSSRGRGRARATVGAVVTARDPGTLAPVDSRTTKHRPPPQSPLCPEGSRASSGRPARVWLTPSPPPALRLKSTRPSSPARRGVRKRTHPLRLSLGARVALLGRVEPSIPPPRSAACRLQVRAGGPLRAPRAALCEVRQRHALAVGRAAGCRRDWGPGAGRTDRAPPTVFNSRGRTRCSALGQVPAAPPEQQVPEERRAGAGLCRRRGRAQKCESLPPRPPAFPHSRARLCEGPSSPNGNLGPRVGAEKEGLASLFAPPRGRPPPKRQNVRGPPGSPHPGPGAL